MDKGGKSAQNVISMTRYQPEPGYTVLSQVEAYWEALRGTRLMPARSDIDPRGIESALENSFVLERIAPGIARIRVAGSHLTELMGMEVRGMPLTTFFLPDARRRVSDLLEEVFQIPGICTIQMASSGSVARPALEARMILMPLTSDLNDVSRALGCIATKGELGEAPRRFDVDSSGFRSIMAPEAAAPFDQPTLPTPLPERSTPTAPVGMQAPETPFKGKTPDTGVPYLRLVKSDPD